MSEYSHIGAFAGSASIMPRRPLGYHDVEDTAADSEGELLCRAI
ncbi:hypothetical protein [Nonomuraea sp. NPDC049400]